MKKERFLFYLDWRNQIELMNDEQLRRFMYNLCNYHEEKDVELPSDLEKAIWFGILPVLKLNDKKYEAKAEKSRENGKLGGAPIGNQNARKEEIIQNNLNQPKQPDKRKGINDKGKEIKDKSEMKKDNWQEKTGNSELISDKEEKKKVKRQEINVNGESINITGKKQIEESEISVLDQEISTSINDNSNISEISYSSDEDILNPDIDSSKLIGVNTSYLREILNFYFENYKEWEEDLYRLGIDDFFRGPQREKDDSKDIRILLRRFLEI